MTSKNKTHVIPGSKGEHLIQKEMVNHQRTKAFYNNQMLDYLNPLMQEFIVHQEMVFIGTSDGHGECDASFRAGHPGFIHVLGKRKLIFPEYRGNGVMARIVNMKENPHIGMIFIDFYKTGIGLHVNGRVQIVKNEMVQTQLKVPKKIIGETKSKDGKCPECWVVVEVEEAYIHCSKHVPKLQKLNNDIHWGTDDEVFKGGDAFKTKNCPRPWDND